MAVAFKTKKVKDSDYVQVFYKGGYIYTGLEARIIKQSDELALVKDEFGESPFILMPNGREVHNPYDKYGASEFDRLIKKLYQQ